METQSSESAEPYAFLTGAGEIPELIRAFDWSKTSLGPIERWPQSLKTTVSILLQSPIPIVLLWNADGVMIYNDAYSGFAGKRHPELLGSKVREGWPEVADFNDNVMKVGLAGGTLAYKDQELTLYRSGAPEQVWMNLDYSPVIDESGKPGGVIAIVVETTARVRSEALRQENEARLKFLDELSLATSRHVSADALLAVTTKKTAEHLGVSNCAYADVDPDEEGFTIRGDSLAPGKGSLVGHYPAAAFGEAAKDLLRSGEPLVVRDVNTEVPPEYAAAFKKLGMAATITVPLVKDGRLTALMAVHENKPRDWTANELALMREITERSWAHVERVRAEAELRASDENFRTLARAMPNHVWTAQPNGLLDWFNDRVYEYSGAREGELDGTDWAQIVHPDDVENASQQWAKSIETGEIYQTEFRLRRADGVWRWHLARAVAITDDSGKCIRWIGANTDIHDQKKTEQELAELNETLEQRVAEEIYERAKVEDALRQGQKMEALGKLTGGVAHDFNNLLMAVFANLEMIEKRLPAGSDLAPLVANAREGADRGATLTRRMLAFARRQDLRVEPTDMRDVVDGLNELIARTIGPQIEIDTKVGRDLPAVMIDRNQFELALLNLVVNARDAMPNGGKIEIAAERFDSGVNAGLENKEYVCLSVADTGEGMSEEVLSKAVEPFFSTKGVGKGTGLGLAMVHGLAEQMGGGLRLSSQVGAGTRAEIWMPLANVSAQPIAAKPAPAPAATVRNRKILIVDDDPLILMNTCMMAEDLGHDVVSAKSGDAALEKLAADDRIELVITDHAMPKMTGAELAAIIRERWPRLPVIMATGYAELPHGEKVNIPRLNKPYGQEQLAAKISSVLGG